MFVPFLSIFQVFLHEENSELPPFPSSSSSTSCWVSAACCVFYCTSRNTVFLLLITRPVSPPSHLPPSCSLPSYTSLPTPSRLLLLFLTLLLLLLSVASKPPSFHVLSRFHLFSFGSVRSFEQFFPSVVL